MLDSRKVTDIGLRPSISNFAIVNRRLRWMKVRYSCPCSFGVSSMCCNSNLKPCCDRNHSYVAQEQDQRLTQIFGFPLLIVR